MSKQEQRHQQQPTPNFNLQKGLTGLHLGRMNGWVSGMGLQGISRVSGRCLEGVWRVCGKCLEGVYIFHPDSNKYIGLHLSAASNNDAPGPPTGDIFSILFFLKSDIFNNDSDISFDISSVNISL